MVLDEDQHRETRELIDHFANTQNFPHRWQRTTAYRIGGGNPGGRAYVGLQIPPGFTRDLRAAARPRPGVD